MIYAYGNNINKQGSGWAYKGYIVTAKHVIEEADRYYVEVDNSTFPVKCELYYKDPNIDLAILKPTKELYLPSVKLGNGAREGEKLIAITSPLASKNYIDECIYIGIGKNILYPDLFTVSESEMTNGSSGGAVFNFKSELIGMVIRGNEANTNNVIPINKVKPILEQQIK